MQVPPPTYHGTSDDNLARIERAYPFGSIQL